jgi:hypothetical protein
MTVVDQVGAQHLNAHIQKMAQNHFRPIHIVPCEWLETKSLQDSKVKIVTVVQFIVVVVYEDPGP